MSPGSTEWNQSSHLILKRKPKSLFVKFYFSIMTCCVWSVTLRNDLIPVQHQQFISNIMVFMLWQQCSNTYRWWRTCRWRRRRWVFDDLDKQKKQRSISTKSIRGHVQTHTQTHTQTLSRQAQTRLTEVIRDRRLSQTETSPSSSHGGDTAAARLLCSCNRCPIAPLTTDYKDSACKPTSGAPCAK